MFGLYSVYLIFIIYLQVKCEDKVVESKNPLPYFRRQVEEIAQDTTAHSSVSSDTRSNLVSFLIKNVRKIYSELDDIERSEITTPLTTEVLSTSATLIGTTITEILHETEIEASSEKLIVSTKNNVVRRKKIPIQNASTNQTTLNEVNDTIIKLHLEKMVQYSNVTQKPFSKKELTKTEGLSTSFDLTEKEELMHLSKNLIFCETDRRQRDNNVNYYAHNASYFPTGNDISLRSCIFCNNVASENCNDPRNRLIPSTVCEGNDDVCYSQHTPFGVIDRGCYNVNHNLTTYVCSCNLCNYISISEMPYVFSTKRDWFDNVVELSRTRHLRKSVFKDMSCLKCESNASAKTGDMLDTANCLEGNIGSLPTEECDENEVCAVKAIKHDGYVWRGCVKEPLFNFWWAYCDSDLCNFDLVTSIYDIY